MDSLDSILEMLRADTDTHPDGTHGMMTDQDESWDDEDVFTTPKKKTSEWEEVDPETVPVIGQHEGLSDEGFEDYYDLQMSEDDFDVSDFVNKVIGSSEKTVSPKEHEAVEKVVKDAAIAQAKADKVLNAIGAKDEDKETFWLNKFIKKPDGKQFKQTGYYDEDRMKERTKNLHESLGYGDYKTFGKTDYYEKRNNKDPYEDFSMFGKPKGKYKRYNDEEGVLSGKEEEWTIDDIERTVRSLDSEEEMIYFLKQFDPTVAQELLARVYPEDYKPVVNKQHPENIDKHLSLLSMK